ncbi:MAG: exodeoxyribonuclease VII large subunit [Paludibacter sp.]|jgi:exodeoxyribonuclease VII large subunit|nr:exodeoxyribonuclease VII large subunit [Paludibacter sp.]
MESISLFELTSKVKQAVKYNFSAAVWVRAEISTLSERAGGHCYLELVEKDESDDRIKARSNANIWANTYKILKPYFESNTGENLRAGLNVLVAVTIEYHEIYGFSLNIKDIEPSFTVGELAARRIKIIRQLESEGVAEMNRSLKFPALPQRIAVITSATAAGYDDFVHQITNNPDGFAFYLKLFPAVMQGEQAEGSIIAALDKVFRHENLFDAVLITRGGGATTDLACFDSYNLAINCCQFPLPIITAIGHQRDVSILDMVAHTSVKTPTAAAEMLLQLLRNADENIDDAGQKIYQIVNSIIDNQQYNLEQTKWKIRQTLKNQINSKFLILERQKQTLSSALRIRALNERNRLHTIEQKIESHSPSFLLKHGYSITIVNGARLTSVKNLQKGDKLLTFLPDGSVESVVEKAIIND